MAISNYIPTRSDVEEAYKNITQNKQQDIEIKKLFQQIKINTNNKGLFLHVDWEKKTEENLRLWAGLETHPPVQQHATSDNKAYIRNISHFSTKEKNSIFWTEFLRTAQQLTNLFEKNKPTKNPHIGINAGISNVSFNVTVKNAGAFIDICMGMSHEENANLFNQLLKHKSKIEQLIGEQLKWDGPRIGRDRCIITSSVGIQIDRNNTSNWPEYHKIIINKFILFRDAFIRYGISG